MRLAAVHLRCPKRCVRSERINARTTAQRRPSRTQETQGAMHLPTPTALESFSPGLTPELSRAAKRRRLERIVRADVTAEAREPQAATPRTTREPLTGSRVTRRPRLEEPKPERRPTEARAPARERATASTTRRDNTRARTRRSTHAAWRRRTRAVRSDASKARSATRESPTSGGPAKRKKRRALCNDRS